MVRLYMLLYTLYITWYIRVLYIIAYQDSLTPTLMPILPPPSCRADAYKTHPHAPPVGLCSFRVFAACCLAWHCLFCFFTSAPPKTPLSQYVAVTAEDQQQATQGRRKLVVSLLEPVNHLFVESLVGVLVELNAALFLASVISSLGAWKPRLKSSLQKPGQLPARERKDN